MVNLLWDLDGTLIDSMPIIAQCFNKTLQEYGLPTQSDEQLRPMVGPALDHIMGSLLSTDNAAEIDAAKAVYREFYKSEMINSPLFSGIDDALKHFQAIGFTQYVATAKYQDYGQEIIQALGVRSYFAEVYGSMKDGRLADKSALLKHICSEENITPAHTIMIGDTHYDIEAALNNKLTAIAVGWGYGNINELVRVGAHFVAQTPADLPDIIRKVSECGG